MIIEQENGEGQEVLEPKLAEILKPEHTGIVVVDIQKSYVEQWPQQIGAGNTQLKEGARRVKEFLVQARKHSPATIVFTRMYEDPSVMSPNIRYKMTEIDNCPPISVKGTSGWEYYEVSPEEGDHEIEKRTYSSFIGTDLHDHLQSKGVKSLIVIGAYGSVCVSATVQDSSERYGYHTFMPPDLVANLDSPEEQAELKSALHNVEKIYGYTRPSGAILNAWEQASKAK